MTMIRRMGTRIGIPVRYYLRDSLLLLMDTNHADQFIDDEVHSLDQSVSRQHLSWKDLPDREGLNELLTGILERSRIAAQGRAPATDNNNRSISYTATLINEIARSPGPHDYPLWRVRCRVSRLRLL
jgi:hypothetical protein